MWLWVARPQVSVTNPKEPGLGTVTSQWSLSEDSPHCSRDQLECRLLVSCPKYPPCTHTRCHGEGKGAEAWKAGPFTKTDYMFTSKAHVHYRTWINFLDSLNTKPPRHLTPCLAEHGVLRYNICDDTAPPWRLHLVSREERTQGDRKRSETVPVFSLPGGTVTVAQMVSHIKGEEWNTRTMCISGKNKRTIHCFIIVF